jgi:teichuronic acid exporter
MTGPVTDREPARLWQELGRRGSHAALQLAIRSVILRGLTFIGTVILARLLAPSDFGVYGIVAFVVSVCSALGDFGLGAALVQQAEEPTPGQLRTVWTMQQGIALAAVVVVWLAAPAATAIIAGLPSETAWMLRVLSLGLLLSSLRTLPAVMMERELRFGPLATAEVMQMVTFYTIAVALAIAGAGAWAFVLAGVAQLGMGAAVVNLAWRRRPSIGIDRGCLAKLLGFGFDYQASALFLNLRDAPLPALVGLVSGTAAAGLIQFAVRLALTIASIDEIVARIAFPAFARLQGHPHEQARALDAAILMTGLIVIPVQCWIAALAPILVPLVFGSQWSDAILPLQIICLGTLLRFPTRYLRQAEFAEGASRRGLSMSFATTVLALGPFALGLLWWGLPGSAIGFLVGAILGLAVSARLAQQMFRLSWRPFALVTGAGVVATATALLTLHFVGGWLDVTWPTAKWSLAIAVEAGLGTVVFSAVCLGLLMTTNRTALVMGLRLAGQAIARKDTRTAAARER